ncbi:hypothetical protein EXW49_18725 [Bacillus mycoides]|uniref:EamA domain-containing protein n=1 Tax=Bacillus cereus VD021 TaxID=1053224 RepID=R8HZZ2_BACCE|nr:hypothetical protein [Bacillus cereus]EOO78332.1 hypothetical protein IIC_00693 [Bacillus cereus VD021]QWH07677.1 hypothetical protein EXW49_18725 [Bacillus mycoides]
MALGLGLIVLGVLIICITTSYMIRENEGISWIEVLVFPIGLILSMILGHFELPEFLILIGLVCIVLGSLMTMGISII